MTSSRLRELEAPQAGHFQRWLPAAVFPFFTSLVSHSRQRVVFDVFGTVKGAWVYRSLFYRMVTRLDEDPIHTFWPVTPDRLDTGVGAADAEVSCVAGA